MVSIVNFERNVELGDYNKSIENPRLQFCGAFNFTSFGCFRLRYTLKLCILEVFEHKTFFTQAGESCLTKARFSEKCLDDFSEVFTEDVKLMTIRKFKFHVDICAVFELSTKSESALPPPPREGRVQGALLILFQWRGKCRISKDGNTSDINAKFSTQVEVYTYITYTWAM